MSLQGEKHTLEGPALKTDSPGMVTGVTDVWPKGYRSVNCFCGLAYLDCAPTDSYKPVAQCDNKNQVRGSFPFTAILFAFLNRDAAFDYLVFSLV